MMILEALELYVEGGRVNHSWCMCVHDHGYDGLGEGKDGGGGWYACGTKPRGRKHIGRYQSTSRVRGDTLITPDHIAFHVGSSW